MGFENLLGNDRLKENLTVSLGKGRISHFYLISGPAGSGKRTLAKMLACAILCKGSQKKSTNEPQGFLWASLVARMAKNPPAMWENWV